jgi:hypothetical protein
MEEKKLRQQQQAYRGIDVFSMIYDPTARALLFGN